MKETPVIAQRDLETAADRLIGPKSPFELAFDQEGPHFVAGPRTLLEIYRRALRMADAPLIMIGEEAVTYSHILQDGLVLAGAIRRRGLQGQRIALDLEDKKEWLRWFVAVTAAGASAVLLPPSRELQAIEPFLIAAGCDIVVSYRPLGGDRCVQNLIDLAPSPIDAVEDWSTDPIAEAVVVFTSGSTGKPKGVRHSQRGLIAGQKTMMLIAAVVGRLAIDPPAGEAARPAGPTLPFVVAPLSYVAGYSAFLLAVSTGGRLVMSRAEATIEEACELVQRWGATSIVGGGDDFIRRLVRMPGARDRLKSLRRLQLHGAGVRAALRQEVTRALPDIEVFTGYGLTETCGAIASAPAALVSDGCGGGWIAPSVAFRLRSETGSDLEATQLGMLEVRGDMAMMGYLDPSQGEAAFTPDGWFRTGDLCRIDQGRWLVVHDRAGGAGFDREAMLASEIEGAVRLLDDVDEVVVKLPAEAEALRVIVQSRKGGHVSESDVAALLSERALWTGRILLERREVLPRTGSGKLDREGALA